jgi:hypothetical protein
MFCPKCCIEYVDGYSRCNLCDVDLIAKRPKQIGKRIGMALLGLLLAMVGAVVLITLYVLIPGGVRFPAIILGVPAVAVAAGLFQAVTGLTIFEVNEKYPRMSPGKRFIVGATLIILLLAVLGAFYWFIYITYEV